MTEPNLSTQKRFHQKNRKNLRQAVKADNPDLSLLVVSGNSYIQASGDRVFPFYQDSNFLYLTGLQEPGLTLVIDGDQEYLIVPERSTVRVTFEGSVDIDKLRQISGIEEIYIGEEGWSKLKKRMQKIKQVGTMKPVDGYVESLDMFANPARQYLLDRLRKLKPRVTIYDLRPHLLELRMIKSRYEIRMIEQAIKQTQKLFSAIERQRSKAKYEHELLAEITRLSVKQQLSFAYDPVIASGNNALTLHYIDNNAPLDKKGFLLLDIGLKFNGYSADITRTISYSKSKRHRQIYEATLAANEHAISLLKPGVILKDYEEEVTQFMGEKLRELGLIKSISKESVREYCPHATSHFLGLDTHDVGDYETPIRPGMILTVEPGIYIPEEGIGIRLEDDILVTPEGNKVLTNKLPKNLASLTIRN